MSYTVTITVKDCQTNKPIQGASVYDGRPPASTTDSHGQCKFLVVIPKNDPNIEDTVKIWAEKYGPATVVLNGEDVTLCLEPFPKTPPANQPTKPIVTIDSNEPATLTGNSTITVSWVSSHYDKFLIRWTGDGQLLAQGEVDTPDTSGTWTTNQPVDPGAIYTFEVEGGTSAGLFGYNYGGWGNTVTVKAVANLRSLVQFLKHSGLDPVGLSVRSIMGGQTSLKRVMKLA